MLYPSAGMDLHDTFNESHSRTPTPFKKINKTFCQVIIDDGMRNSKFDNKNIILGSTFVFTAGTPPNDVVVK